MAKQLHFEADLNVLEIMKNNRPVTFTLRIPRDLKERAERKAGAERMSMNTWVLRLMERAARPTKGEAPVIGPTEASMKNHPVKDRTSHGQG